VVKFKKKFYSVPPEKN